VSTTVDRDGVFKPSDDLVVREIDGQLLIVPIATGIGDLEDELYALNDTARFLWTRLDGRRTVADLADELAREYGVPRDEVEADVTGLIGELLKRRMVLPV